LNQIKKIKKTEEIKSLDKVIYLIQKQMDVIGGCLEFCHVKGALENAYSGEKGQYDHLLPSQVGQLHY